jgi:hypothetical protein
MRNRNRYALALLVLCTFLFVNVGAALAEKPGTSQEGKGTIVLERPSQELQSKDPRAGARHTFDINSLFATNEICGGSCGCSDCSCSGSFSCCLGGCLDCWDFLDDMGACGVAN